MTKLVTLVVDTSSSNADYLTRKWKPEQLALDLAKAAKLQASVFVGTLGAAPDSWAYILYTNNDDLAERAKDATVKARLAKTIAIEDNPIAAPHFAERHGLLGAMDTVASSWGHDENYIVVQTAIGRKLGWALCPIQKSAHYARTAKTGLTLPALLVRYWDAALGPS